jgi:hypothetical protein
MNQPEERSQCISTSINKREEKPKRDETVWDLKGYRRFYW